MTNKYYKAEDAEIAIADALQFESEVGRPYKVFLNGAKDMLKNVQSIEIMEYPQVDGITPTLVTPEVSEEDELKFYYVDSIDDYWIGQRHYTLYYAKWLDRYGFVWTHSRYLPWGEHIVDEDIPWKKYTYPSEPREIPFTEWIVGFMRKRASEDTISRQWLLDSFRLSEKTRKYGGDHSGYDTLMLYEIQDRIEDAPSVIPQVPNEDAISREWLISFIDAGHLRNPNELCYSERGVVELIKHAPSVVPSCQKNRQVGRAEGEWIIHKINGIPHTVECSRCHQHYDYEELRLLGRSKGCIDIPHCPNCGARMKGAE